GPVTRGEIPVDKERGWSKGFGFFSFPPVEVADPPLQAFPGAWMDGKEIKFEKGPPRQHTGTHS
ncbi:hypothetical protein EMIHUDRAFT_50544, partial [Emiliania huxleyi CCMP1516]|uniref:RRM domain-containing protein n=2 Tax=Emiliania huxleyi TaxID=2903 RepID=A0A0D3IY80_EMIH1